MEVIGCPLYTINTKAKQDQPLELMTAADTQMFVSSVGLVYCHSGNACCQHATAFKYNTRASLQILAEIVDMWLEVC